MKVKFGVDTFIWTENFLEKDLWVIKKAEDLGFEAIDFAIAHPETFPLQKVKEELSKTKLALILFCRAEVFSSFNSKIVKEKCRGKRESYFQLCHSTLTFHKYSER